MSAAPAEPALALSFFDSRRGLSGTVRSGLTLLFDGREARADAGAAELSGGAGEWGARGEGLDLTLRATTDAAELGGISVTVCAAEGRVGGATVTGLGTVAETLRPPGWRDLEAVRAISAVFEPGFAALALARRPRGSRGHGDELVEGALFESGSLRSPEDARISTVYADDGRQHTAGLELWFPGEDYPRRLFGTVQAGTSLHLGELRVQAAAFTWRMEGRTGSGLYELTERLDDEPAAA